ncbi:MAG: MFS transporter [Chloroflexota bacterium]
MKIVFPFSTLINNYFHMLGTGLHDAATGNSFMNDQMVSRKKQITVSVIILLALLTDSITVRSISLLAPFIRTELNISTSQIGYLMSSLMVGTMLTALPLGSFMERVNIRLAYGLILAAIGICFILITLLFSFLTLIVLLFIIGLLRSGIISLSNRVIAENFGQRRKGIVAGIIFGAYPAGGFLGAVVLPTLGTAFDSRAGYFFIGLLAMLGGLAAWIFLEKGTTLNPVSSKLRWSSLGSRVFVILTLCYGLFALSTSTEAFFTLYMVDAIKISAILAGTFLGLISLVGMAGRLFWGFLGDRYFSQNRCWLLALTSFILAITLGLLSIINENSPSWLMVMTMIGFGLSAASSWPVMTTLIGDVVGIHAVATGTSILYFITNIADSSGPILFGKLLEWTGSYQLTMGSYVSLPIIAMLGFLLMAIYNTKSLKRAGINN